MTKKRKKLKANFRLSTVALVRVMAKTMLSLINYKFSNFNPF